MPLSHKLELRQSQSLVMTPQLLQAIKLLQLSQLDLISYVDAELERNPLLERGAEADGEAAGTAPADPPAPDERSAAADGEPSGDEFAAGNDGGGDGDGSDGPVLDPASQPAPVDPWSQTSSRELRGVDERTLEAYVAEEKSLAQHLVEQLGLVVADARGRAIGQVLINEIDEDGYIRTDIAAVAERLGAAA